MIFKHGIKFEDYPVRTIFGYKFIEEGSIISYSTDHGKTIKSGTVEGVRLYLDDKKTNITVFPDKSIAMEIIKPEDIQVLWN
jgi:Pyruvate/2-oxoacid:ferredoxin oxidoreductase gamma subunit